MSARVMYDIGIHCRDCYYYEPLHKYEIPLTYDGLCLRYPPDAKGERSRVTYEADRCGEWREA